jgi:heptosyltransferase-2
MPHDAPARLLVVAPNWLGDAVMALPLVADVRRTWPRTQIAVAARASVARMFEMVRDVDHVTRLEGGGGWSAVFAAGRNARALAAGAFDAALVLPNSFVSAWVVARAGIRERWGYRTDARGRWLTHAVPTPRRHTHQADYYQQLGVALDIPAGPRYAKIDVSSEDRTRAERALRDAGLPAAETFIAIAPGAAYGRAKQWLPERFAELTQRVASERHMWTVAVGTAADQDICREIARRGRNVINLAGRTDLRTLAGVLSLARAVAANDSGAMHLAAAVGSRVVAIFGATNEHRTAPLQAGPNAPPAAIVASNVWCRPCMLRECPIDHRCMASISADAVLAHL